MPLGGGEEEESVRQGARCAPDASVRRYDLVAINIEITLNRFLDYDPEGRMYVLEEELGRARREEAQNKADRADRAEPAVSIGLQGDAIQALTIRANQGECLRIALRNGMDEGEPASAHIHGSGTYVASTGGPAIATNPDAMVATGETVVYEWMIGEKEQEGVHYFHSHGTDRLQTGHGLFGALVVEPAGSTYIDPQGGGQLSSGWSAIIRDPQGSDFREFAIFYHEIGDERFRHRNKEGVLLPFIDPRTGAYNDVRVHVMVPFSEQNHVFTIEGHRWPLEPGMAGSDLLSAAQVGATETLYIELEDGAGGQLGASGDYLYGDHREPYREAGLWGLFRVYEPDDDAATLHRLVDG